MRKTTGALFAVLAACAVSGAAPQSANALPLATSGVAAPSTVTNVYYGDRRFVRHRLIVRSNVSGCYWLKRRAINTGSHYWWHRYEECRNG